jgi:hypothetical protein|tara:strand:- start:420 stop:647 length:228 start_codon:yes stop_codon:yes gene_type:complete
MHYKKTLIGLTIVLGLLITQIARADGETSKTETFGTKVSNHISMEIENTKEFQKKKWAETKAQWSRLFKKFQAED